MNKGTKITLISCATVAAFYVGFATASHHDATAAPQPTTTTAAVQLATPWQCWTEHKQAQHLPDERICGPVDKMPVGSTDIENTTKEEQWNTNGSKKAASERLSVKTVASTTPVITSQTGHRAPGSTTTTARPAELEQRIPNIEVCTAIDQQGCDMPEHEGMSEG